MMTMGFLWLVPLIFVGLLVAYLLGRRPEAGLQPPGRQDQSSLEILKDRYARGEISREEYQEMRRDLAG
jgi:putative membrane protein